MNQSGRRLEDGPVNLKGMVRANADEFGVAIWEVGHDTFPEHPMAVCMIRDDGSIREGLGNGRFQLSVGGFGMPGSIVGLDHLLIKDNHQKYSRFPTLTQ